MTKIEKLDLKSKDIKSEQVERLKKVFPEIVADGKINFEQLKATLGEDVEDSKERFGMTWSGKSKCFRIIQDPSTGTLKPSRKESVNFDTTDNLFIEGDNLEVLKLLQKSYYEKIKMIYIDPPYNTGNDFVYPDSFGEQVEEYLRLTGQLDDEGKKISTNTDTDGRYHSNWLNMMYPRLFLAKNLLADNGVIFISIDDNEIDNLKKICNEIFGEENFLNQIVLENDSRARPYGSVATTHEYILVYSKSIDFIYEELRNHEKEFKYKDKEGGFDLYELRNRNIAFNIKNRPNLYYSFWVNPNNKDENGLYEISLDKKEGWIEVYPQESQGVKTVWRWGKDKAKENLNTMLFGKEASSDTGYQIVKKYRENTYTLNTVWSDKEIKTDRGTLETKGLFDNKKFFDFPKPVALIKRLMSIGSEEDSIVMDFFAGSGTTAHAVLDLNKEDGGNRKFMCVQLPEPLDEKSDAYKAGYKTIADISKERIRRVIKKIEDESKQQKLTEDKQLDLGFRVFKLDRSNFKKWDNSTEELQTSLTEHVEQIKKTANPEDVLYEILIKDGFELTTKIEKTQLKGKDVFSIENNLLLICLDEKLDLDLFKEMKKLDPHLVIVLDKGFKDNDQLKTNAVQTLGKNSDEEYILRSI